MSLSAIIFAGVFDRFPNLHAGSVEHELSSVPYSISQPFKVLTQEPPIFGKAGLVSGTGPPNRQANPVLVGIA